MVQVSERQSIFSINAAIVCQGCIIADSDRATESIYTKMLDGSE
jgi:hypothetical protein